MSLSFMWVVRSLRVGSEFSSDAIPAGEVFLIRKTCIAKRNNGETTSTKKIISGFSSFFVLVL